MFVIHNEGVNRWSDRILRGFVAATVAEMMNKGKKIANRQPAISRDSDIDVIKASGIPKPTKYDQFSSRAFSRERNSVPILHHLYSKV